MTNTTARRALLSTIAAVGLVGALFAPAAGATGKDRGDRDGDADRDRRSAYTEDDDHNDGGTKNNVADAGDNRHPSGKDRSVEKGRSGNQGKAESDPDDDGRGPDRSNGGPDKPNGSGGVDKADQDGNNGCGNDDDFEDDNEGWCGHKPKKAHDTKDRGDKGGAEKPRSEKPKHDDKPKGDTSGKPGGADQPKHTEKPKGNGTADITVVAECRSVSVTSSKDISHVVVWFADGTVKKFDGLSGHTWTRTFDKDVAGAKAKSATTVVGDMAGSCATTGGTGGTDTAKPDTCPAGMVDMNGSAAGGCTTPGCPTGMVDTNGSAAGGCALPGSAETPCPTGMVDTNGTAAGGCEVPAGTTTGGGATAAGGSVAPAGEVLSNTAERPASVSAAAAGTAAAAGASGELFSVGSLAFTGLETMMLVAVALGLLALGFVLVRSSRRRAETTAGQ